MGTSQSKLAMCSYAFTKERLQCFKVVNKPLPKGTGVKSIDNDFDYEVIQRESSLESEDDEWGEWPKDAHGNPCLYKVVARFSVPLH